jgi:HK97 family phage prohead protease
MDEECKLIIDSEVSVSERTTNEMPLTRKFVNVARIESETNKNEIEGYISTVDIDHSGDIVIPDGFIFDVYQKNPIVLFQHDSSKLPIGKATHLVIDKKGVKARIEFADTYEARDIEKLIRGEFLNSFSIGFIPVKYVLRGEPEFEIVNKEIMAKYPSYKGNADRIIQKTLLLEFSVVTIPDNSNAVVTQKDINDLEIKQSTIEMLKLKCNDCSKAKDSFKTILETNVIDKSITVITNPHIIDKSITVIKTPEQIKVDLKAKLKKEIREELLTKKGVILRN